MIGAKAILELTKYAAECVTCDRRFPSGEAYRLKETDAFITLCARDLRARGYDPGHAGPAGVGARVARVYGSPEAAGVPQAAPELPTAPELPAPAPRPAPRRPELPTEPPPAPVRRRKGKAAPEAAGVPQAAPEPPPAPEPPAAPPVRPQAAPELRPELPGPNLPPAPWNGARFDCGCFAHLSIDAMSLHVDVCKRHAAGGGVTLRFSGAR